ncbi:MAG: cytochrome c peroxidase [Bacteroidota bacterium]|nr:cytochrome c peroxidase [Bacteroidota bacterium]
MIQSCKKDNENSQNNNISSTPTPYKVEIPKFFPTDIYIPSDNPLTNEGVELGRYLFYDGKLAGRNSPDSMMSCGTCHIQQYSFKNGKANAYGITGIKTPHTMLPLINLLWNPNTLLWNGKVGKIEDLIPMGITAPHELNTTISKAVDAIKKNPVYPSMFKKAFGTEEINIDRISKAIAQFVRTLISSNSKFDKYLRGEGNLTAEEMDGYSIFSSETGDCFHCHGTVLFTTNLFYNNAKDSVFTDTRDRYSITHNPSDIGAYVAPTLRNIELTAPYMHDGRFKTLEEVVDFYSEGLVRSLYVHPLMKKINQGGAQLTSTQKKNLILFLKTLTDNDFVTNPKYSKPTNY